MKTKSKLSIALLVIVAMILSGCASTTLATNPNVEFPVGVTDASPAFVVPISLHFGGSADKDLIALTLTGGLAAEFGASVISGQQAYDMVGNLSWTLGENLRKNSSTGEWSLSGGAKKDAEDLAGLMGGITDLLAGLGLVEAGFEFKYIIILHADSAGGLAIPKMVKFVAFGGLVDITTFEILSYIEQGVSVADNEVSMLAQVPLEFNKIIKTLIAGE